MTWFTILVVGFAAGALSGAFGIGGGILTTPAVRIVLAKPAAIALGTPLAVIIPTAAVGALTYHRARLLPRQPLFSVAIGAVGGIIIGSATTALFDAAYPMIATAGIMMFLAVRMVRTPMRSSNGGPSDLAIGMTAGVVAGLLGLGGGFVLVPMLSRRYPMKQAIALSLATIAIASIPGAAVHGLLGHVDWGLAAGLAVGVVPGAIIGAHFTISRREVLIRRLFALFLFFSGAAFAAREIILLLEV